MTQYEQWLKQNAEELWNLHAREDIYQFKFSGKKILLLSKWLRSPVWRGQSYINPLIHCANSVKISNCASKHWVYEATTRGQFSRYSEHWQKNSTAQNVTVPLIIVLLWTDPWLSACQTNRHTTSESNFVPSCLVFSDPYLGPSEFSVWVNQLL